MKKIISEREVTEITITHKSENIKLGKFKAVKHVVLECGHTKPKTLFKKGRVPEKTHCDECKQR